jgi:hypothetical protein
MSPSEAHYSPTEKWVRNCEPSLSAASPATSGHLIAVATTVAAAMAACYSQRRDYRALRRQKCQDFLVQRVEVSRSNPHQLWHKADLMLGRCKQRPIDRIDTEQFNDKMARIRDSSADAPPPAFTDIPPGVGLPAFTAVTTADVTTIVRRLPDKASAADPILTSVLKAISDFVSPYVTKLLNRLLVAGHFPAEFRRAFITPIVKRAGLDINDVDSYQPISNLSVLSKTLERGCSAPHGISGTQQSAAIPST